MRAGHGLALLCVFTGWALDAKAAPLHYLALGDSISKGAGTTHLCAPRTPVQMKRGAPDNPCSHGTSWADRFANTLAVHQDVVYQNVAESGYTTRNLIDKELPMIDGIPDLISVFIGTNNFKEMGTAYNEGYSSPSDFEHFHRQFRSIIETLQSRFPNAEILILNVPNTGILPYFATHYHWSESVMSFERKMAQRGNLETIHPYSRKQPGDKASAPQHRIGVVDLTCDPVHYQDKNLNDGLHPNDAGAEYIAEKVYRFFKTEEARRTEPLSFCPPYLQR